MTQVNSPAVELSEVTFTKEQVAAAVERIVRAGKTFARGVESLLVMAVHDSIVNQSAEVANALIGALRRSTKRDGVIGFLEKYGQLYNKSGKIGFVHFALGAQSHIVWSKAYVKVVQEAAMSWESFKPAPPKKGAFDVVVGLEKLLKAHDRCAGQGREVLNGDFAEFLTRAKVTYVAQAAIKAAAAAAPAKETTPA